MSIFYNYLYKTIKMQFDELIICNHKENSGLENLLKKYFLLLIPKFSSISLYKSNK